MKKLIAIPLFLLATFSLQATANPLVAVETTLGNMEIELYEEKAPITVKNFLAYVDDGFFNGTIFHRVIPNFVIQGGGFETKMVKKTTKPPIKNESDNKLKNLRYTLSMARTNAPDSASSQFFINLKDNGNLDQKAGKPGYAVFAKVVKGMDVVDAIAKVKTGRVSRYSDVPMTPVIMTKAYRLEKQAKPENNAK